MKIIDLVSLEEYYFSDDNINNAIEGICDLYSFYSDVVLGEFLATIAINDTSVENVILVVKALRKRIDGVEDNVDYTEDTK